MSNRIYTGVWTDWSLGRVAGTTITLSARDGGLLLAFIAIFVTVIAARLWRSLTFVCHQVLASGGKHDGLHHQRQFILRNIPAPVPATWLFLQQAWHWRGRADRPLLRTVPWAVCGFLYAVLLGLAAVFSSKVSESATPFRLLEAAAAAADCGMFVPEGRDALQQKNAYDNSLAAVYSRQCYGDPDDHDKDVSPAASCGTLPVPSIRWTNASVECPFADEVCMGKSFRMETGMVDSHTHLGINEREQNRVQYWRETDCAPLVSQRGFSRFLNGTEARELGWDDDVLIKYFYGGVGAQNYTHIYNTYGESTQIGYSTWVISSDPSRNASLWRPIEALALDRRDLTLLLIAPNSIVHLQPNDDPVFGAHIPVDLPDGTTVYRADRYASPVACADRHRICNPNNGVCTAPQGAADLVRNARAPEVGLNAAQVAAVDRIGFFVASSTFHQLIWTRTQSYLRAQELVAELLQLPLPSDQWQIEMGSLFAENLAKLQHQMAEYVTGPSIAVAGAVNRAWEASEAMPADVRAAHEDMCRRQRTRDARGTLNFSVLGLAALLGLGSLFVAFSYALEPAAQLLQRATGLGVHKARRWERDENLQVMRMLFEAKDAGVWRGSTDSFPTTESKDYFEWDGDALEQHSRYTTLVRENYDKS